MTRLEKFITDPLPQRFLSSFPHDVLGCHNLHLESKDFPPKYALTGSEWQVFLACQNHGYECLNPLTELTRQKIRFIEKRDQECMKLAKQKMKLTHLIDSYSKALDSSSSSADMSRNELQLMNLIKSDPDVYFSGSYNWYCGGQICNMKIDSQPFIATVQGRKSDEIQIVHVLEEEQKWFMDLDATLTVKPCNNSVVYEIISSHEIIGIRNRNMCTLYNVHCNDDNILEAVECFHDACKKPAVSMGIDAQCSSHFCILDVTGKLTIWDTNHKAKLSEYTSRKIGETNLLDNWGQLKFSSTPNIVNLADRLQFQIMDFRNQYTKAYWKVSDSHFLHSCENISFLLPSSVLPFDVYLGTTHHIILIDTRNMSNIKQIWTHMMKSEPQFACTLFYNNSEVLLIGNQEPAEVEVICNNNTSNALPVMLSSLKDSLRISNAHGHSLHLDIRDKASLATGGLACLENAHSLGLTVLIQTVCGDIFSNQLYDSFIYDFEKNTGAIPCWEHPSNKRQSSKNCSVHVTGPVIVNDIYKECIDVDSETTCQFNCWIDNAKKRDKWHVTRETLEGYQDILSARIQSKWDIDTSKLPKKEKRTKPFWKEYVDEWLIKT